MGDYRSPLLDLPGAVASEGHLDAGVAAHYGDPLREQRQLAEGVGFVDLSHRAVVRISGADRLSWLHNLTTQKLDALAAGASAEALILSPQGHVEHHLQLVDDGESTWAHVEPGDVDALVGFLTSMRFMLQVVPSDVTADWAVVWEPIAAPHATLLARVDPQADAVSGRQVFVPRAGLMTFAAADDRLGPAAGVLALEALRVEAGRPRFGVDTDHRTIPHEMGWIGSAVKLDKGCYRGRRRWPESPTLADRRGGSCACISMAARPSSCLFPGATCCWTTPSSGGSPPRPTTTSSAPSRSPW
jgi:glycine cleavage system aminomethyltransferase T